MPKYVQIARTNDIFRPKNNNKDSVNVYDVFFMYREIFVFSLEDVFLFI